MLTPTCGSSQIILQRDGSNQDFLAMAWRAVFVIFVLTGFGQLGVCQKLTPIPSQKNEEPAGDGCGVTFAYETLPFALSRNSGNTMKSFDARVLARPKPQKVSSCHVLFALLFFSSDRSVDLH